MLLRKLFLLALLPAVLMFQSCGPEDVVNPVTPPVQQGGGNGEGGGNGNGGGETPGTPSGGDAVSMTVCTFNIRYANTADKYPDGTSAAWSVRKEPVKKFLDATKPDLIGLQEVRKEQSQWFASLSSEYGYYDVSRDNASGSSVSSAGGEGVGIMYRKDRFELELKDFFWLDDKPRERPAQNSDGTYGAWNSACRRVTVYAKLKDKKNGTTVYFLPTHYDHKSSDARKKAAELNVEQIKAICKVTDIKNAANVVIFHVGDLNTTSESSEMKPLMDAMNYARLAVDGTDKYTGTFNGFGDSNKIIDHIFYGGKAVKPVKYWVDRSTAYGVPFLSDHYPVLFKWEYQ